MVFAVTFDGDNIAELEELSAQLGLEAPIGGFASLIGDAVLFGESLSTECIVNLCLTDPPTIRSYNSEYRDIDSETDVLSFPNLEFEKPGDISIPDNMRHLYTDPETGLLYLGDMMISLQRVLDQAKEYGHSPRREFGFLIAHSMLHLCGYDHESEDEEAVMIAKQDAVLSGLGIDRE